MKASFMILPALLMSAAAHQRASGGPGREKKADSEQAPPPRAPTRGWFDWAWTRRPAPKKADDAQ
jgi:hypothetical protein